MLTVNPRLFPESDQLRHQPRRRPGAVLRQDLRSVGESTGAELSTVQTSRHDRPRAHARGPRDRCRSTAVLGRVHRLAVHPLRLARVRRAQRVVAVLHLGHHRQPERCSLLASFDDAAHADDSRARCHRHPQRVGDPVGGAHVPRQRVGDAVHRGDGRRQTRDARTAPRRRVRVPADEIRRRQPIPGCADGVDDAVLISG